MRNSWTGGQYSLFRALLGLALLSGMAGTATPPSGLLALWVNDTTHLPGIARALGMVCALFLILGKWDRPAAWILFFLTPLTAPAGLPVPLLHPYGFLLLRHLLTPAAPYGSLAAVGRPDPGGGWQLPLAHQAAPWLLTGAGYAAALVAPASGTPWWPAVLGVAGFLIALHPRARVFGWLLHAGLIALLVSKGLLSEPAPYLMLSAACFDPAWLPPQRGETGPERLFYDGGCGLCHRACRFILAEDGDGSLFRLTPLQSPLFAATLSEETRRDLPDSLVLVGADGSVRTRSSAVLTLGLRLGGLWRPLAATALLIPRPLRDAAYAGLAAVRHRLFAEPADACPIVPVHLRTRFEG